MARRTNNVPAMISLPRPFHIRSGSLPVPPDTPTRHRSTPLLSSSRFSIASFPTLAFLSRIRSRLALVSLVALALLSLFTLSHSFASAIIASKQSPPRALFLNRTRASHPHRKQIVLREHEELAAVTQFVTSLSSNALPSHVDPSKSIDPQLICGFDTTSEHAPREIEEMLNDVWSRNPIVLFKELRSPIGRQIKQMLEELNTKPGPVIVDVDEREDSHILIPLLRRLTSVPDLPILLLGGQPTGPTISELRALHDSGELQRLVAKTGAVINGAKKIKGGRK